MYMRVQHPRAHPARKQQRGARRKKLRNIMNSHLITNCSHLPRPTTHTYRTSATLRSKQRTAWTALRVAPWQTFITKYHHRQHTTKPWHVRGKKKAPVVPTSTALCAILLETNAHVNPHKHHAKQGVGGGGGGGCMRIFHKHTFHSFQSQRRLPVPFI